MMNRCLFSASLIVIAVTALAQDETLVLAQDQVLVEGYYAAVDLTHAYNGETIYWPTAPYEFEKESLAWGETPGGWFYSANAFRTPEHGGTHMDAPIHFHADGDTVDEISLDQLIAPAVVIDVSEQSAADRNYRLSTDDVRRFEAEHGVIRSGTVVLLRTGWAQYWPDRKAYMGDDTPGETSRLSFPSYGEGAARLLIERKVAGLGVDTASIDYGQSADFIVHRIAAERNVYGLENLTNLDRLPPTGATIIALPIKIEGGSGGPVRAIALIPRSESP